jgi:lysophospholipase L1-like esterase
VYTAWLAGCGDDYKPPAGPTPTPLAVSCPADLKSQAAMGQTAAVITYSSPGVTGGTAPIQTSCTPASGSSFPIGTTSVQCRASDATTAATCSFSVVVDPPPAAPRLAVTTLTAFGDSLTEGKISLGWTAQLVESDSAYTLKLQAMLQRRYTDQTITVINEGLGGKQASDPTEIPRLDGVLDRTRSSVLLLMDGANDLLADPHASAIPRAISGLDTMIAHAKAKNVMVFLASIPPQIPNRQRSAGQPFVAPLNDQIHALATSRGVIFVDVYAAFNGDLSGVGTDGLHLNDAGYEIVARAFYDKIVAALEVKPATARR